MKKIDQKRYNMIVFSIKVHNLKLHEPLKWVFSNYIIKERLHMYTKLNFSYPTEIIQGALKISIKQYILLIFVIDICIQFVFWTFIFVCAFLINLNIFFYFYLVNRSIFYFAKYHHDHSSSLWICFADSPSEKILLFPSRSK